METPQKSERQQSTSGAASAGRRDISTQTSSGRKSGSLSINLSHAERDKFDDNMEICGIEKPYNNFIYLFNDYVAQAETSGSAQRGEELLTQVFSKMTLGTDTARITGYIKLALDGWEQCEREWIKIENFFRDLENRNDDEKIGAYRETKKLTGEITEEQRQEAINDHWFTYVKKKHYVYVYFDGNKFAQFLLRLSCRSSTSEAELACLFMIASTYIGEGQRDRIHDHLNDSANLTVYKKSIKKNHFKILKKLDGIRLLMQSCGIVAVKSYRSISHAKASFIEAIKIDAIGLSGLLNAQSGNKSQLKIEGLDEGRRPIIAAYLFIREMREWIAAPVKPQLHLWEDYSPYMAEVFNVKRQRLQEELDQPPSQQPPQEDINSESKRQE